jgi:RNA polymerase sigma-70 factor (ECF subfamily)
MQNRPVRETVDHLFRHEYGRLTSVLTRIFGTHNLDLAEDVVQDTLLKALEHWRFSGIPENPSAWLFKVAKNKALDLIRREKRHHKFAEDVAPLLESEYTLVPVLRELFAENKIQDDQLRMMFACCNPGLPSESQVALILKTLCGFSIAEIARAFLTNHETINKRMYRARQQFRNGEVKFEIPADQQLEDRLENVLTALYLLFNEGYNSTTGSELIRKDLIEEACRLCLLLTQNERTSLPQVNALLSLMLLHASRMNARLDDQMNILLLSQQDRSLWDKELIKSGIHFFEESMTDGPYHSYQLQAAIALQHATAPAYEQTDWGIILNLYNALCKTNPSPVTYLNRAIVIAELEGPEKAMDAINKIPELEKLKEYYLLPATIGELYLRENKYSEAKKHLLEAIQLTQSPTERKLLEHKLEQCEKKSS